MALQALAQAQAEAAQRRAREARDAETRRLCEGRETGVSERNKVSSLQSSYMNYLLSLCSRTPQPVSAAAPPPPVPSLHRAVVLVPRLQLNVRKK